MDTSATNSARRAALMPRVPLLAATGLVALFNGTTFSPFFDSVAYLMYLNTRGYPLISPNLLFYVTPVPIALMTLMLAGIPAAIYERIRGLRTSTGVSLGIWLVATILLSLPTIMRVFGEE
jgi:hypothetical protein